MDKVLNELINIEWKSILLILGIILVMLIVIKLADMKFKLKGETKRKLFHMGMGLSMLALPYIFTSMFSVSILAVIALIALYILKNTKLKKSLGNVIYDVERKSYGEIYFTLSVLAIFYLSKGDKILYGVPILILTLADSTAALIGKSYGKKNLAQDNEDSKSIEGSFMFFMVAFMVTLVPLLLYTEVGREETLLISLIVGFNVALVEMISHSGNDNILIPLTTFAFISIHLTNNVETLRIQVLIIGILFILATIVNRIKFLSKLAIVEAIVIAYLTTILFGWYAIIPPLILLLVVFRFPKLRENEKSNQYDARIIETNVIIPIALCGISAITQMKKEIFLLYAAAYGMHLVINSFVRFKYYVKWSEIKSLIIAIIKGIVFAFIPAIAIQLWIFGEFSSIIMILVSLITLILSGIVIYIRKRKIATDEISIDNGYKQMGIVLVLTCLMAGTQFVLHYFNL